LRLFDNGLLEIHPLRRYGAVRQGGQNMAEAIVPHFHNDVGVSVIEIGAKEFMCVGAMPPFDHPHVFCDMGEDTEYVCPYCSTLYRHNPTLAPNAARPAECALHDVHA
jgi:uncharacterized Zn-finger protein